MQARIMPIPLWKSLSCRPGISQFSSSLFFAGTGRTNGWNLHSAYNLWMARGWESKSVEEQQAEATPTFAEMKQALSPDQAAKQRQREGLRLSRKRALQQLQSAQNPRRRKMLEDALADLDAKLTLLG